MKFSLNLPDNQDHKTPIVKGKLPITIFNQPFTSSFTSAINSSSDLSFSLSTNFTSGPCLKLTYSPMLAPASPSAAASTSTTGPFTLSLKSGLGIFGSPDDSPLVFSSQFSLSLSKPFVPTFSLLFNPQFGHFCLKKSTVSSVNDRFSVFQPNDGVQLDSGSDSNPKFGSGFAVDEPMGWQELKLESSSSHGSQEEFGGIQKHLAETKSIRDSVFRGVAVMARTAIPVTKKVAVNFRWGMNFPTNPVSKMPFLTVNKISVERVEEEKEEKKQKTGEGQGGDVELLKGMLFWMKNDVETLEKENKEMKQLLEEIKMGSVANRTAPSSGLSYGDSEPWRNNRSGWEESKSKNNRNSGQENDWRKKKSYEEENESKNNRRAGEKNGGKAHSSMNRANEVESELERAIKAASQVKA